MPGASWVLLPRHLGSSLPAEYQDAYFELVDYPIRAAAAQNAKFLDTDRSFLDEAQAHDPDAQKAAQHAQAAYAEIGALTARYNGLANGKWAGMMSDMPRDRQVFHMPKTATLADATTPLPQAWKSGPAALPASGFMEQSGTISINAARYLRKSDGNLGSPMEHFGGAWHFRLVDCYGQPGQVASTTGENAPWLEYDFTSTTKAAATLIVHLLPTFPVDADHRLRFQVSLDGRTPIDLDLSGTGEWKENSAPTWAENVLRNSAVVTLPLGTLSAGKHTLRLVYGDPAVVFEHLVITFPASIPAYPVPPETGSR